MTAIPKTHRRVVLVRRPPGEPVESDFRVEEVPVPAPRHGEVLVKVLWLSLDPYQRGRMRDAASYAPAVGIGEVMTGGTVGEVVASQHPGFAVGDIVEDRLGWQEYAIGGGPALRKVDPSIAPISTANGILGMPGMTAYFGLLEVGQPKPGETIVVSAASGAVGQVVGQIGRIMGCRVVGIAGGQKKCGFVTGELGFDACVDYKAEKDLDAALRAACPNGIDVYFDNVGGEITDAVLRNINFFGRVALCGSISQYNATTPPMGPRLLGTFVGKRVRAQGFIVTDFAERYGPARRQMGEWVRSGRLKYREDVVEGIAQAPRAFIGMLRGDNFGKMLVKVG
jgi:NADPH-dependent curcumin reductase CurA